MDHTWLVGLGIFAAVMALVFLPTLIENVLGALLLVLLGFLPDRIQGRKGRSGGSHHEGPPWANQ